MHSSWFCCNDHHGWVCQLMTRRSAQRWRGVDSLKWLLGYSVGKLILFEDDWISNLSSVWINLANLKLWLITNQIMLLNLPQVWKTFSRSCVRRELTTCVRIGGAYGCASVCLRVHVSAFWDCLSWNECLCKAIKQMGLYSCLC